MLNRRGPKMEPWGTPHVILVCSDVKLPIDTKYFLFSKYVLNQFSTVPERPAQFSSRLSNMLWSTVLNAVLRSSKTKTDILPLSVFRHMSLNTLVRAVSVLWFCLKPDWKAS